jgi:hypothetical protein
MQKLPVLVAAKETLIRSGKLLAADVGRWKPKCLGLFFVLLAREEVIKAGYCRTP